MIQSWGAESHVATVHTSFAGLNLDLGSLSMIPLVRVLPSPWTQHTPRQKSSPSLNGLCFCQCQFSLCLGTGVPCRLDWVIEQVPTVC